MVDNVITKGEIDIFEHSNGGYNYFEQFNYYYGIRKILRIYTKYEYPLLNNEINGDHSISGVSFDYKIISRSSNITFENIGSLMKGAKSSEGEDNRNYYNLGYIYITGYKNSQENENIPIVLEYKYKYSDSSGTHEIEGKIIDTIPIGKDYVCDAIDCQLYYRPFYYNALLLLTPTGFTGGDAFYSTKMPTTTGDTNIVNSGVLLNTGNTENNIYQHLFATGYTNYYCDQKNCYGRLFYSIANGLSIKEKITNEHNAILNTIYTLDNVTLQTIVGSETNVMKLNKPFRNYSEMSHSTSGETFSTDITSVPKVTKMMMYGITEPFTMKKGKYERGVPIVKAIDGIDIEQNNYNKNSSINTDFNVPIGDIVFKNLTDNTLNEFTTIQTLDMSGMTGVTFDTSQPMNVAFSITEGHLMGEEGETIGSYYNGIKFYENIYVTKDEKKGWILTVDGYSSKNVRYYALTANGTNEGIGGLNGTNEIWTILNSITDMQLKEDGGAVRYSGLNNNDYISRNNVKNSGWRDIHTYIGNEKCLVDIGSSYEQIDITANLSSAYIDENGAVFNLWNDVNSKRRYVIGIYSEYSKLLDDEREEERINMYSVVKKHTPRFSVVKLYKINIK